MSDDDKSGPPQSPYCGGPLDDLIALADERLVQLRGQDQRSEANMFASKFEIPDYFGARVTAVYDHLTEAQSAESNRARREALRKGLSESCRLLQDIDMGAVSYELEELLRASPPLSEIPPPPGQLERFLKVEHRLLSEAGVSGAAIDDIDRLIRQLTRRPLQILQPDDMVLRFRRLQELVCARSKEELKGAEGIRERSIWFGVAGCGLILLNAGGVAVAAPTSVVSVAFGGGLVERALGDG